jgi:hypothetical protein
MGQIELERVGQLPTFPVRLLERRTLRPTLAGSLDAHRRIDSGADRIVMLPEPPKMEVQLSGGDLDEIGERSHGRCRDGGLAR